MSNDRVITEDELNVLIQNARKITLQEASEGMIDTEASMKILESLFVIQEAVKHFIDMKLYDSSSSDSDDDKSESSFSFFRR